MRRDTTKASKSLKISTSSDEIMLPIYKGIPELFEYVIGLVEREPRHDIESIVTFHLLNKILNATEHAIIHYFAISLSEPFLQNSHRGSPYQKWALVTNENFQKVAQYVKSLKSFIDHFEYKKIMPQLDPSSTDIDIYKNAMFWLHRLDEYTCCEVSLDEPILTVSAINFDGWLDTTSGSFDSTSRRRLKQPPVVIQSAIPIADRSVLKNIQGAGIKQVEELRRLLTRLADWLEVNYSMSDITVVPAKNQFFYEHWMENRC